MYVTTHRAIDAHSSDDILAHLRDRAEVLDALYRFGLGQDLRYRDGSRELFASAFAEDAVLDFRDAARKCGLDVPLMTGRELIVSIILNPETKIDTTHVVSNPRVQIEGDHTHLSALVEARHLPTGDHTRNALLKNIYDITLVRDGARWVMQHVYIDCIWFTGDPAVITGN